MRWRGYCGGYDGAQTPAEYGSESDNSSAPSKEKRASPSNLLDLTLEARTLSHRSAPLRALFSRDLKALCDVPAEFNSEEGVLDRSFWTDTIHDLIQNRPTMAHVTLACLTIGLTERPGLAVYGEQYSANDARGRALGYYGSALRLLGQCRGGNTSLRNAIVCCVFCVVFETMIRDHEAAEAHFQSGQKMAIEWRKVQSEASGSSPTGSSPTRSSPGLGGDLYWELHNAMCFLMMRERGTRSGSPESGLAGRGLDSSGDETSEVQGMLPEFAMLKLTPDHEVLKKGNMYDPEAVVKA